VIQRIRTPEAIFREEKKDIFALKFKERNEKQQFDTLKKMEQWFALQLKESKTEVMGPPEASPYIEGGPKMLRIDFSNEDLKIFMDTWKDCKYLLSNDGRDKIADMHVEAIKTYARKYGTYGG
jgi:hypothetical protein